MTHARTAFHEFCPRLLKRIVINHRLLTSPWSSIDDQLISTTALFPVFLVEVGLLTKVLTTPETRVVVLCPWQEHNYQAGGKLLAC